MNNRPHVISMNLRYKEGLKEFKKRCTDHSAIMDKIDELFEKDILGIRTALLSVNASLRVLDIGCGDGKITNHLVQLLVNNANKPILLDIIEPEDCYIQQTKEKLKKWNDKITLNFIKKKAEEYFNDKGIEPYHLIFSSHSLHLISLDVLPSMISLLEKNGVCLTIIGSKHSIMSTLKDFFAPRPAITGKDIYDSLKVISKTIPCQIEPLQFFSYLVDLSDIEFNKNKDKLSENAKNLLSLMFQKNIDDIGQAEYAVGLKLILDKLSNGSIELDNDCIVVKRKIIFL